MGRPSCATSADRSAVRCEPNELLIAESDVENGPYRGAMFAALVDANLTGTDHAQRILGSEFIAYLNQFFGGWKFVRRVERRSRYRGGPFWKHVSYVLVLGSDADVETVRRRLATGQFDFALRFRKAQ
jgi:hypothetical protein